MITNTVIFVKQFRRFSKNTIWFTERHYLRVPEIHLNSQPLIDYLKFELGIAPTEIAIATRNQEQASTTELPILLWQYGLIDLNQLDQILEWNIQAEAIN